MILMILVTVRYKKIGLIGFKVCSPIPLSVLVILCKSALHDIDTNIAFSIQWAKNLAA